MVAIGTATWWCGRSGGVTEFRLVSGPSVPGGALHERLSVAITSTLKGTPTGFAR